MNVTVAEPPPAVCTRAHSLSISHTTAALEVAQSSVMTVTDPPTAVMRPTWARTRIFVPQIILPDASVHFHTFGETQLSHLR